MSIASEHSHSDQIIVQDLVVRTILGVDRWERSNPQPVRISVVCFTDISAAGATDHLPYSINYGSLCKEFEAHCAGHPYRSLEALAEGLARVALFGMGAPKVKVKVEKTKALLHAQAGGVEIFRAQEDYLPPPAPAGVEGEGAAKEDSKGAVDPQSRALDPESKNALGDRIFVKELRLNTIIGIHPWEREEKQVVLIDLDIHAGYDRVKGRRKLGKEDVVSPTHNYRTIVRSITEYVENSSYKTVESLATAIAHTAITRSHVGRITVRLSKPSALMFASCASVQLTRDRTSFLESDPPVSPLKGKRGAPLPKVGDDALSGGTVVAVALGSNLGDRAGNIERALREIESRKVGRVVDTSFLYETPPMYLEEQPAFLNGACKIVTPLSPAHLLSALKSIEADLGRTATVSKGPRVIDLDIILYGHSEVHLSHPDLTIPHIGLKEREFVLWPLSDIMPGYEHPILHRTISQLLSQLRKTPEYTPSAIRKILPHPRPLNASGDSAATSCDPSIISWADKTLVMGILNATPDSFSDGGDNFDLANAVASARRMLDAGADVLDVGGMSTRPGAPDVSEAEERTRVVPLIAELRKHGVSVPISIDTFRASVAEAAVEAGASWINDVTGGAADADMLPLAARLGVPIVLMHTRGDSRTMTSLTEYDNGDVPRGVALELAERVQAALKAGVRRWNIILDPGVGFAKDLQGNLALLRSLPAISSGAGRLPDPLPLTDLPHLAGESAEPLAALQGYPTLVGVSRKGFLGKLTGRGEPKERAFGTAAACTAAVAGGCNVIRVHDVKEMVDVARTADAIYRR